MMANYTEKYCYEDQPQGKNPNLVIDEEDNNGDYENEDVISFCDLPMYNSSTAHESSIDHHEDSFKESCDSKSSSDEDQDSLFEFFSDEWNITKNRNSVSNKPSNLFSSNESIMFFGKIIQKNNEERKNSLINVSRSKKNVEKRSSEQVMVPKMSVYTVPLKSKLLLVLFGLPPKVPKDQTELMTDIRNRQSRHAPTTFFPVEGGCEAVVPVRRRSGENGLWRFIKAASCFGGGQKHTKAIA